MTINDSTPVDAQPMPSDPTAGSPFGDHCVRVAYFLYTEDKPEEVDYEVEVGLVSGPMNGREVVGLSVMAVDPLSRAEITYIMPLMSYDAEWSPPEEEVISSMRLLDEFRGIVERILPEARRDLLGEPPAAETPEES